MGWMDEDALTSFAKRRGVKKHRADSAAKRRDNLTNGMLLHKLENSTTIKKS